MLHIFSCDYLPKMIALVRRNLTFFISKHCLSVRESYVSISTLSPRGKQTVTCPTIFDILLHKHHFSPEAVSLVSPHLVHLKSPQNADSVLSFFKENGFSTAQLEKMVMYRHRFLSASVEKGFKPKIKLFQDFGFSSEDTPRIITRDLSILHASLNNRIIPSLTLLKGLLGSNHEVVKLVKTCPWFVTANLEKNMMPNIEFLRSYGIPMEHILIMLHDNPRCILTKLENMKKSVEKIEQIGVNRSSKMFVYAVSVVARTSKETWERKLQAFRDLGFSDTDTLAMFKKAPLIFTNSIDKVKTIKEMLLQTGKFNMSSIVNNPLSLACSIENRFKPRLEILGILESRNVIEKWPSLSVICKLPDDKFFEKFVGPYLIELGQAYVVNSYWRKEIKP